MSYLLYFLILACVVQGQLLKEYSIDDRNCFEDSDRSCNVPAYSKKRGADSDIHAGQLKKRRTATNGNKKLSDDEYLIGLGVPVYRQTTQLDTAPQNLLQKGKTDHSEANQQITSFHRPQQNFPEIGHDTSSTPVTSGMLPPSGFARKSPAGGQLYNWEIGETVLQSVFHDAANQLSSRPTNGKIYEAISDKKRVILERLKELSHSNSKPSIDVGLEMADGAYLLKLMNITTSIDVVQTARQMGESGAMFLQQAEILRDMGEKQLHQCRETLQSLLNASAPATETDAADQ